MSLGWVVCRIALLHQESWCDLAAGAGPGAAGLSLIQHSPLSPTQNPSLAGLSLTEAWDNPQMEQNCVGICLGDSR